MPGLINCSAARIASENNGCAATVIARVIALRHTIGATIKRLMDD